MRLLLFLVLAGCAHDPTGPVTSTLPPPQGESCARVGEHLVGLMAEGKSDVPVDTLDKLTGVVQGSCEETKWTEEARTCMLAATTHADVHERCETKLTEPQKADLNQRLSAAFRPPPSAPKEEE